MNVQRVVRLMLLASILVGVSAVSFAGVFISVSIAPPPIPVYEQPLCPGAGYIWTPGYWAWSDDGYYWVPGTWVIAPQVGYLWTPGYWGWSGGAYIWNAGYWGPHVGFYGGINYGFGYGGFGYEGGEWRGRNFYYNRTVNNVNVTNITNVYNKTVVVNNNTHVSYNGGHGGVEARPSGRDQQYRNERHVGFTREQEQHFQHAARDPQLLAKNNGGRPQIAATARPGDFQHAVAARNAGGRVDRAALTANQRTMPARNEKFNGQNNRELNNRGNNVPRPMNNIGNQRNGIQDANTRNVSKPSASTMGTHERTPMAAMGTVPRPPQSANGNAGRTISSGNFQERNAPRPMQTENRVQNYPTRGADSFRNQNVPRPMNSNNTQPNYGMRNARGSDFENRNVPRPNATSFDSRPVQNMPRQNQPARQAFNNPAPRSAPAPQRSFAPAPRANVQPARSFTPAPRPSAPAQRPVAAPRYNAPAPHANAPVQRASAGGANQRPRR